MTTIIIPEIVCTDSLPLHSNETTSVIVLKTYSNKNFYKKEMPLKNKHLDIFKSLSHKKRVDELLHTNFHSAPVSVVNTPNWKDKRRLKGEKQKLNLHQGHYSIKKFSTNSSESSYIALNHSINSANCKGKQNRVSNNNSVAKSQESKLKTCCLCWCCCYTFSCLNVNSSTDDCSRHQISNDLTSRIEYIILEEKVTVELLKKWSESFDNLLQFSAGQKIFREFLKSEYSEENILFYLACEDLKKEKVPDIVEEKARFIYEDYISILSPKEVSLDSRVREIINDNMVEPTSCTFDEAQLQIYTLMHRDSYPRFLNSKLYKDLLIKLEFDLHK